MENTLRFVKVRFLGQSNPGIFQTGNLSLEYGQKVVAMSERGMAIGHINSYPFSLPESETSTKIPLISKIATDEDIERYKQIYQEQRAAGSIFSELVTHHHLPMNLDHVEHAEFGKKIIFYYTSPSRVDFRELLKSLSKRFKERIELRQIPSGSAAQLSTIGPCGMELCLFIKSVMKDEGAKRACSEFHCCLDYKDPFYEDKRSRLPKVGDYITTQTNESGRVEKLDLWKEEFEILTDNGVLKRFASGQLAETLNKSK
jgi:cell fate regulator YaaT (PSP1 superfamily)